MKLLTPKIFLVLVLPLCLFLSFNKHSKDKANSYHGVIWADASGYYVYEPMWFLYGNNPNLFPDSVEVNTGYGFHFDNEKNKVITKYPSGVAILQSPFFLASHFLAPHLGFEPNGFSKIYSYGLYVAGVIYCCLGLFLLSSFLMRYFSSIVSLFSPLLFLISSNLFYYSIDNPGMSHVYSFFLFSCVVYITPLLIQKTNFKNFFLFFLCIVLITLTRPTNCIIAVFPLFYSIADKAQFFARLGMLLKPKVSWISALILSSGVAIPQLYYWYETTGSLLTYSYRDEHFIYWNEPKFIEVWFSTKNGLFLYTPVIIISFIGIIIMLKREYQRKWESLFIVSLFVVVSYICASWWCWWFGCAFGARSFVEYYAFLVIPLAYIINEFICHRIYLYRFVLLLFIVICCYVYMDMEYYYDGCFYGETWDFTTYLKLFDS